MKLFALDRATQGGAQRNTRPGLLAHLRIEQPRPAPAGVLGVIRRDVRAKH